MAMPVVVSSKIGGGHVLELEEKVEELESVLAQLKVDIKELLVDLKALALRGQDPVKPNSPSESVARATL